jgi:hypothetical protein
MLVKEKLRLLIRDGRKTKFIATESFEFPTPSIIYDEIFQNGEKVALLLLPWTVYSYYRHYNTYALK